MSSRDEWAKYAVEIRIPTHDGMFAGGSGYVTSSCRILTALHVVVDEKLLQKGIVKPRDGIMVRAYGDFIEKFPEVVDYNVERVINRLSSDPNQDFGWRPAKLAWPSPEGEAPPLDLAILELDEIYSLSFTRRLTPVRCSDPEDNIGCRGIGFPSWTFLSTGDGSNLSRATPARSRRRSRRRPSPRCSTPISEAASSAQPCPVGRTATIGQVTSSRDSSRRSREAPKIAGDAEVDAPIAHRRQLLNAVHLDKENLDLRKILAKCTQAARQKTPRC